ncbi:MAG: S8 family peptidase [Alphaproteobacteria bacterium]|nr:S8 family peptidase [Alphaproteobacteria bacterium]MDX5414947.1 S8 family peptidase [Alphaproteobacteria bacterium]MDX5492128.1 S8 family peptidase [Alphaproteobacteria bacterium]
MPNNPVQIVLNDDSFIRAPEPGRAGPDKDFFEKRDTEFAVHRAAMIARLDEIDATLATSRYGPVTYVRVRMRPEAIAKSYRPNRALFLPDQFPCVGAGAPGELFYRLPRLHLRRLRNRFESAEPAGQTRISGTTGKPYHYVTRARSELGAIEFIEVTSPEDKRKFAAAAAVDAMLNPSAASGYIVELFEQRPLDVIRGADILGLRQSFETLQSDIAQLGDGMYAALLPSPGGIPSIELLVTTAPSRPLIEDRRTVRGELTLVPAAAEIDIDVNRHEKVLTVIAAHPLVRRIRFPAIIESSNTGTPLNAGNFSVPARVADGTYPKVGVIDTGICSIFSAWIRKRYDYLDEDGCDPTHGTLVAGILIGARGENGPDIGREPDGCDVVDIPLMPKGRFLDVYGQRGFEAFLEEMEAAIIEARDSHNVRIFNMSLNVTSPVEQNLYSIYAARLDEIQDRNGVIIVNSAGNLNGAEWRSPWPRTPRQAIAAIAARTALDTIYMPCESVRALAVGALNPPGGKHIVGAPATYSRRGPGLRVGVKPDLAHYGGTGDSTAPHSTALISCALDGSRVETRGTSFAAPLVAKTLANLDAITGQQLETRTLRAFAIHDAAIPDCLNHRSLRDLARQFVGFGQPKDAVSMLETDDHSITMVFESRLSIGEKRPAILRFPFTWPASLVDPNTLTCRGKVRMTLVYDPPIDQAFGTEFVRVNLDAKLRQRQTKDRSDGLPSFHDQVTQAFLPRSAGLTPPERALISHGLKWWPTKRYTADFGNGVGNSTEWQLQVESVVRAESQFPAEGVPFSLIVTIEDPDRTKPIFQELRRQLVTQRVDLHDIRTAVRIRPRSRR